MPFPRIKLLLKMLRPSMNQRMVLQPFFGHENAIQSSKGLLEQDRHFFEVVSCRYFRYPLSFASGDRHPGRNRGRNLRIFGPCAGIV